MGDITVAILSPGDMGHAVGHVLVEHGLMVKTCLEGRSRRTQELAKKAGIESVPNYEQLVCDADIILSILKPSEALNAATTVAGALGSVGERIVYVDCNAIAPNTVKKIAEIITGAGSRFVDAGIIGAPPARGSNTRLYASGPDIGEFEVLCQYGLDIKAAGTEVGQASGFKMVYAALTKGSSAISIELLVAAFRMGLYRPLVEELQRSQRERYASIERSLPVMPSKSRRWVGEMEEIAKTFEDVGLTPRIFQGAADIYRFVGETALADETPEHIDRDRTLAQLIETLATEGK